MAVAVKDKATVASNGAQANVKVPKNVQVIAPVRNDTTGLLDLRMATSAKKGLSLNLPLPLQEAIVADSTARKLNPNAIVREVLAAKYGYNILDNNESRLGRGLGLSKEERAAINKSERDSKAIRVKAVMAAIKTGKLSDEMLAQLGISLAPTA